MPSDNQKAASGYLSEEHKRKFTITAGILGAVFFIVQFILPFVIMLAIMPGMMFFQDSWIKIAKPERGAFWDNRIWYPEMSVSFKKPEGNRFVLKYLNIDSGEDPEDAGLLPIENPWLLAGEDRLWMISSSKVGFFQAGNISVLSEEKTLGDISRPFLHEGHPAVIEEGPNGFAFVEFVDGAWQKKFFFALKLREKMGRIEKSFQVVPSDEKLHLFLKFGDTLYYREKFPAGETDDQDLWRPISEVRNEWFATLMNREPAVFVRQTNWLWGQVLQSYIQKTKTLNHLGFRAGAETRCC